jgi:hypothetical protein
MRPDNDDRGQDEEHGEEHRDHAAASTLHAIDDSPELAKLGEDLLDRTLVVLA